MKWMTNIVYYAGLFVVDFKILCQDGGCHCAQRRHVCIGNKKSHRHRDMFNRKLLEKGEEKIPVASPLRGVVFFF